MCGRFTITRPQAIKAEFGLLEDIHFSPRFNLAPSQTIPIIRRDEQGVCHPALVRWGLLPFWAKNQKIAYKLINARAETLAEKPAFRDAYRKRRCLIPADGFYEWQRKGPAKQPYYIRPKNGGLIAFAGLWELWQEEDGEVIESATIVTTTANPVLAELHDRMPLIVARDQRITWLEPENDPIHDQLFLKPYDPAEIVLYPVSYMVNYTKNDSPACIERVL